MTSPGLCSLVAYDFLDIDVYWNIHFFYAAAGYTFVDPATAEIDLLVVLRGDPGALHPQIRFAGSVHIYDYVKELKVDWRQRFPAAEQITVISLSPPGPAGGLRFIEGYIPIFPSLWQIRPFRKRLQRPLHISNFKPMPEDSFQQELITLARHELIHVYGRRWECVDVKADAVSYWRANQLLASAYSCYGLMYPYQRGRTLSGRMWQAPLNGCFVISETGTNPFGCPGVIEVKHFDPDSLLTIRSIVDCWHLQQEATPHWQQKTERLREALGLQGSLEIPRSQLERWRRTMHRSHIRQQWQHQRRQLAERLLPLPVRCRWRRTLQGLRRLVG